MVNLLNQSKYASGSRNIFNRKIHALEMKLLEVVGEMGPLHAHSLRLDYLEEV